MTKRLRWLALGVVVTAVAVACSSREDSIVVMTHDSFAVSEEVLASFTDETGITVEILRAGDGGTMVNQAILTKDNPLADVLFGVDNTLLSRAVDAGIFTAYRPPGADLLDAGLLVPGDPVTPVDVGDVCLNYDRAAFAAPGLPVPESLSDLTDPAYRGMLVVEDPATSTPGLAFLLATITVFGEDTAYDWHDYWTDLRANDIAVTAGWEEAYYGQFSGGAGGGTRPLVVSYASSPPAEVLFGELSEAPTGVITDGCFRQIEYVGILAGSDAGAAAQQLIDFFIGIAFQEDIPLTMFVFPVRPDAALPALFAEHTTVPDHPAVMDPGRIDRNRQRWIAEWTEIMR